MSGGFYRLLLRPVVCHYSDSLPSPPWHCVLELPFDGQGGLAKPALVLILITYYFHDLAEDFLISDLTVRDEVSVSAEGQHVLFPDPSR